MISRFRVLVALLAYLALTVMTVEGLWASACPTDMDTHPVATVSTSTDGPADAGCSAEMTHSSGASEQEGRSDVPPCPWMPLGAASSCAGVVALPVASIPELVPSPEGTLSLGSPDHPRDLLVVLAFFRPPIA